MGESDNDLRQILKKVVSRALKATVKGTIVYVIYLLLSFLMAPVSQLIPGIYETIEAFVVVYIVLMILGEFSVGTLYYHFFGAARQLFAIGYLVLSLNGGLYGLTLKGINLLVDLRLFVVVALALSSLGLARTVLQAIDYMNGQAEISQL